MSGALLKFSVKFKSINLFKGDTVGGDQISIIYWGLEAQILSLGSDDIIFDSQEGDANHEVIV
jgi:hypothetical protein